MYFGAYSICLKFSKCYNKNMKKLQADSKRQMGGYTTKSYAFTLIELLVVIAIIGILAGVIIASLNSARTSGRVAAIKSNLKNLQTQAIMYHADNGTFAGLCTYNKTGVSAHSSIQPMIDALVSIAGADRVRCVVRTSDVPLIDNFFAADSLETKNFGVAVYFNERHYAVDAQGVMTLDTGNNGGITNYATAILRCSNVGKRLVSIEILKAINDYGAEGGNLGFTIGTTTTYWSATLSSTSGFEAYHLTFGSGVINIGTPTNRYVRCAA